MTSKISCYTCRKQMTSYFSEISEASSRSLLCSVTYRWPSFLFLCILEAPDLMLPYAANTFAYRK
uniref:Uncharacterized protein n=1 Tax=Arundo donax TaxID=35708 RepID=A0A0A9D634_ARUDO